MIDEKKKAIATTFLIMLLCMLPIIIGFVWGYLDGDSLDEMGYKMTLLTALTLSFGGIIYVGHWIYTDILEDYRRENKEES